MGFENSEERFDEAALSTLEEALFERHAANQSMRLSPVAALAWNRMGDWMFDPSCWHRYKSFVRRIKQRLRESPPQRQPYEESLSDG